MPLRVFKTLGEWISPSCCDICGRSRDSESLLCPDCLGRLRRNTPPFCLRCGHPLRCAPGGEEQSCPNCRGRKYHFRLARSVYMNEGSAHDLVLKLKYGRALHLAPLLAAGMRDYIKQSPELSEMPWTVVCVPQSWLRRLRRGYNQAEEIAREVADGLRLPFKPVLRRSWKSRSQTALSRSRRLTANVHTATVRRKYAKDETLANAHFLIIDDVLTTGGTLEECARALRETFPGADIAALTFLRSE